MDDCLTERIEGVGGRSGWGGKILEKLPGGGNGELAKGGDVVALARGAAEGDEKSVRMKTAPAATGAGSRTEKAPNAVAGGLGRGLPHATIELGKNPLIRFFFADQAARLRDRKRHGFAMGTAEKKFAGGRGPLRPGSRGIDVEMPGDLAA